MKSRPLTYLLLVAALGVWGVVAWKLFSSGPKPSAVYNENPYSGMGA